MVIELSGVQFDDMMRYRTKMMRFKTEMMQFRTFITSTLKSLAICAT